jgi:hypothetical protein
METNHMTAINSIPQEIRARLLFRCMFISLIPKSLIDDAFGYSFALANWASGNQYQTLARTSPASQWSKRRS